ncbi:MAG: class II aldolase/adducin family protein [Albidovulum sp.]|nr:class II aldolase/adducin family protein [Albidovulum sp.]
MRKMINLELELRSDIIAKCREMNAIGLNQGTSGNISARLGDRMLITPSSIPYDEMEPSMIASMPVHEEYGSWEGPLRPSSEWRFHLDILRERPDVSATIHAHPPYCTALAVSRKSIPACHYMVAVFGGNTIRCADYATFGTKELSSAALAALEDRSACLLANHGSIATGSSIAKAMWLAVELETIARQYFCSLLIGGPIVLSDEQIADTVAGIEKYSRPDNTECKETRAA